MCAKAAAAEHWDEMGAASPHFAEQTYRQLFRRSVGVTVMRERAKWMRNALAHYIDLRGGAPRGENARTYFRLRATQRANTAGITLTASTMVETSMTHIARRE